jgi:hypothetical protein
MDCIGDLRDRRRARELLCVVGVCEDALAAITEAPTTWYASLAFLLYATTAIAAKIIMSETSTPMQITSKTAKSGVGKGRMVTHARTALLRFSSETRGRFCWPTPAGAVGVDGASSMAAKGQGGFRNRSSIVLRRSLEREGQEVRIWGRLERRERGS